MHECDKELIYGYPSPDIEALFDAHGCPCRFPRFRATVARDLREIGAWDWAVTDVSAILAVIDERVRLLDRTRVDFETRGRCDRCNAEIIRYWAPVIRDSFLEGAHIAPGNLPDVGTTATGPIPIYGSVYHAGAGNVPRVEEERIQHAYPRLSSADWILYMKALVD